MITVRRAGLAISGWTRASVQSGIEQVARVAELEIATVDAGVKTPGNTAPPESLDIVMGDPVEIWVDDERAITGWVEEIAPLATADEDMVAVTVRSRTGDVVDCSAPPDVLRRVTLLTLARALCTPLGVEVFDAANDAYVYDRVKPDAGETVADVLQRVARDRGILITDDAQGRLVLYRPDAAPVNPTPLIRGQNILESRARYSNAERFGTYECRGQTITDSAITVDGRATAADGGVRPRRRKVLTPARPLGPSDARRLCEWEALTRMGRGQEAQVTVSGWQDADGLLWTTGQLVDVTCSRLRLERARLLITDAVVSVDPQSGRRTTLSVQPVQAFLPMPQRTPSGGSPRIGGGAAYWFRRDADGNRVYIGGGGGTAVEPPADGGDE